MTQPHLASPQPPTPPAAAALPSRARAWAWRAAALAAILAVTALLAHYLKNPSRFGAAEGDADRQAGPSATAAQPDPARKEEGRRHAQADLRSRLAGVLMHAADEDGPYNDPANQDADARRRFLADLFGVPYDFPKDQAPADLVPRDAKVLLVIEDPFGGGSRMAILRVPGEIHAALSAVHNHYVAAGWKSPDRLEPSEQTDQGWLVRFTRGRSERIVYARHRSVGGETLVAVYDEPH